MNTKPLSELGTSIESNPGYIVHLPETDYIIVQCGALYPEAAVRFDHPNLLTRINTIHETKTSYRNGRKQWFSHAGVEFSFAIPKSNIHLVFDEDGYSYVPVVIGGRRFRFNVSGGTDGKIWRDRVRREAHIGIDFSIRLLNLLAEQAWTVEECKERNIVVDDDPVMDEHTFKPFNQLMRGYECRANLQVGHRIVLWEGAKFVGEKSAFSYEISEINRRRRSYLVKVPNNGYGRLKYGDVDWAATAKLNSFASISVDTFNRTTGKSLQKSSFDPVIAQD